MGSTLAPRGPRHRDTNFPGHAVRYCVNKCQRVTGGGLTNQVLWVTPSPTQPPAPRYKSSGARSQALHYQMSAHVGKGSPTSDATSATSEEAWNRVGDPLPEARPHSRLASSGTGTGVLALRYLDRGDSVTWMQPPSVTRSGTRPGSPPASPAIRGRGCNLSHMCGIEPDRGSNAGGSSPIVWR